MSEWSEAGPRKIIARALKLQFGIHPPSVTAENLNNEPACELLATCIMGMLKQGGYEIVDASSDGQ